MILLITIIHVFVCLMLIGIILLQPGRGMGLSGATFADSATQSVFGTKTADVLTKATTVAAVLFMVTCIGLSALTAHKSRSLYSRGNDQSPITMNQIQKAVKEAEQKVAKEKTAAGNSAAQAVDAIKADVTAAVATPMSAPAAPVAETQKAAA